MAVPLKYIRYIAQLLLLLMVTRVSAGPEVITRDSRAPDYGVCKARNSIHQYSRVISLTLTARRERESLQKNNDTEVCGDLKRPELTVEPQTWQPVNDRKVIVFSAFYEDRVAAHGPSIRVIASGWQRAYREVGPLFCQLWFGGRNYAASVGPAMYDVIYPSTLFPEAWSSHFIICPLPKVARLGVPYAVSITPTPCETPQNQLLVLHRTRAKAKKQHAVCYPPMYNYFSDWKMVVEMFEMHKLLGADHIVIYNLTATPITNKALLSYIQDNRESVDVVQWPFPFRLESNVNCQRGALNDCLYRTRNQYRYVSVHDLDEVLMPRSRDTWPELMRQIVKPEYGAFMFQHYYFRRNLTLILNAEMASSSR